MNNDSYIRFRIKTTEKIRLKEIAKKRNTTMSRIIKQLIIKSPLDL